MGANNNGTSGCDTGPELLGGNAKSYSRRPAKTQPRTIPPIPGAESGITIAEWRASLVSLGLFKAVEVVEGDVGPISAIGSPRVCVGLNNDHTVVWIERLPWAWSDPYRLFLSRNHRGDAVKYALALAENVRKAADAEHARMERHKAAVLREKFGGAL